MPAVFMCDRQPPLIPRYQRLNRIRSSSVLEQWFLMVMECVTVLKRQRLQCQCPFFEVVQRQIVGFFREKLAESLREMQALLLEVKWETSKF